MAGRPDERQIREEGSYGGALQVGSILGAGFLGYKYRSQIGRGMKSVGDFGSTLTGAAAVRLSRSAKFKDTMQDIKMFAGAMHHAADSRSVVSHLKNPTRFDDRFNRSLEYSLEARVRENATKIGGRKLSVVEAYEDLRNTKRNMRRNIVHSMRIDRIEKDVGADKALGAHAQELMGALSLRRPDWFKNVTLGSVEAFTNNMLSKEGKAFQLGEKLNFADDHAKNDFNRKLFDVLERYQSEKSLGMSRSEISKLTKERNRQVTEDFIKTYTPKDDALAKAMIKQGYERMTVEGAIMHKSGNLLENEGDAVRIPRRSGKTVDGRPSSKFNKLMNTDHRYGDLVADENLWVNARGELMDTRWMVDGALDFMEGFRRSVQVPFLRFNPLDLMHFTTFNAIREAPKNYFKQIGTIDPALKGAVKEFNHPLAHNQDAAAGVLGRGYINTSAGNVIDLLTGEVVKENVYQASARFGMVPRALAGMANLHTKDYRNRGAIAKLFDIGAQEVDHVFERMASTFTKFDNPEWGRNILNSLKTYQATGGAKGLSPESSFKLIYSQFESKTSQYSDDTVSYINRHIKDAYGDIDVDLTKLNTEREVMDTFGRIYEGVITPNSAVAKQGSEVGDGIEGLDRLIVKTWQRYSDNPTEFLKNKRILPNNAPYLPEWLNALDIHETDLVNVVDDVRRLIHAHASKQLEYATAGSKTVTVGSLVQQGIKEKALERGALSEVRNLEGLTTLRQYWDDVYVDVANKEQSLELFASRVTDESDVLSVAVQDSMDSMNPWWTMGPGKEPPQYFGFVGHVSMNKAKGYQWALEQYNKSTSAGISPVAALMDAAGGVVGQAFAGRRNLGDVTSATLFPYYFAERLDNALAQVGLGMSQQNRGSMQSILGNQFLRRIALPYMAYQQAVYLDGMTGDMLSDTAAGSYANMHEDVSFFKELTGFNSIGRQWQRVFGGTDQIAETPLAQAFNFATFGLFSDSRSNEEVREYYESGEDPIRKGRFWGIGSNTPFTGGKVDRYEPNWYRKIKSDYKFTDTMYGSESEYWQNHWMPTLTNPLAPIRHFFLDPYHWEKKHQEDRPYPITGGFSELQQVPLIGPLVDNTVGQLLKPRIEHPDLKKAHREYIEEINNNITAQYELASQGGVLQGMPAGGYNVIQETGSGGGGIGLEEGIGLGGGTGGAPYGAAIGGGPGSMGASGSARQQLAAFNAYYSDAGGPSLGATGKNVRSLTALEDLRDPDVLADLSDIGVMHSASGTLRDSFYSLSEMAGIYGFSAKTMMGFEESGRGMTLEQSSRMTSYARAWWDMELGGLGGQISEIGRRYVPRDPNKNYWNPIKNKMPEWLPGSEYFTDFKHGDPYTKIAHGEMRLPGEAYEKLYKLHPDALGEYGAFDRFRILADVAPYSENYKFYRRMVSQMNSNGLLSEEMRKEYGEVRDQVSERKKKYRFYNRRFDNADVQYENVTITRMIDATTFLTKEHPNNPIRMAGVKIKQDDEESIQWLQQYVHEGAKVRIAVDADPMNRVRDDTYNTMRAVVYAGNSLEGEMFPYSTKGQNVNFMLANRKSGGFFGLGGKMTASTHDDGTATSTHALFSKDMVTVGKAWESLTHDILPSLPIVGTIADKFLQVRSPLEMYKRQEVYGKAWRPWQEPWSGWLQPMFENMASQHPVVGAAQGAGIGWLFARQGPAKYWGTRIGAVVGGGLAAARVFSEQGSKLTRKDGDRAWIPERREREREINEYFDKIKYVKYRGLYERARREAMRREGVDVEELMREQEERGEGNKRERKTLESMKKWLSLSKKLGYGDKEAVKAELDEVREKLKEIEMDRPNRPLGEYSMLALRYKSEYESTLYGADENGDMTKIFRALPSKDREFFTEFMKAAPKEREEILRLVPKDQRRFYQAKWGLKADRKESLESYFATHNLPGANWAGWKPDTSLENYKIKVVKNEGLELTEFGYWGDDEKRAETSQAKVLPMKSISGLLEVGKLERVLRGAGLSDVSVTMNTSTTKGENKINLAMNLVKDRSDDIVHEINNNLGGIFS